MYLPTECMFMHVFVCVLWGTFVPIIDSTCHIDIDPKGVASRRQALVIIVKLIANHIKPLGTNKKQNNEEDFTAPLCGMLSMCLPFGRTIKTNIILIN